MRCRIMAERARRYRGLEVEEDNDEGTHNPAFSILNINNCVEDSILQPQTIKEDYMKLAISPQKVIQK